MMEKFQEVIFKIAETHNNPNTPLTPAGKSLIQDRLNQWLSQYKTPDHPPYSAMIERALRQLNEKGGSSEKSISQFLEKEYDSLPWAHLTFLKHHLGKLCESGDIVLTRGKKYVFGGADPTSVQSSKRKRRKRKGGWDWERDRNKRRKSKRNQPEGEKVEVTENRRESDVQGKGLSENGVRDEEKQVEEDQVKWLKGEQAEDDNPSETELLTTPERPPGFESFIVENLEFLDLCAKSEKLNSPDGPHSLKNGDYDHSKQSMHQPLSVTQVDTVTGEKTSLEHELRREILSSGVQGQIKSVVKSSKKNKFNHKRTAGKEMITEDVPAKTLVVKHGSEDVFNVAEPQQKEHYSERIEEAHDEMLPSKMISRRRCSSRLQNKYSKGLNEQEKPDFQNSKDVLVVVTEESSPKSEREQRQLRRWSTTPAKPKPVEMAFRESSSSHHHSLHLELSSYIGVQQNGQDSSSPMTKHKRQQQQPEENQVLKAEEVVLPGIKKYGRRRKEHKFQQCKQEQQ